MKLHAGRRLRRPALALLAALLASALCLTASDSQAQFFKKFQGKAEAKKPAAPAAPASSRLTNDAWQKVPMTPVQPGEIDRLVNDEFARLKMSPAPLTSDEQFIRRVTQQLTGALSLPAEVRDFAADKDPNKRAKLIDRLLASDEYARYWASYWRDVIAAKVVDFRGRLLARPFADWLTEQLKANRSWAEITRAMLTAEGIGRPDDPASGPAFFLLAHTGAEAANDRAAETSRIFLGIQIQCAQCHNHPFDQWKQVQFHELAGYFARLRERPVRDGNRLVGLQLVALPRGEHEMAEKNDPGKSFVTHPRFLDGTAPDRDLSDRERRRALAGAVVDKNNYWFAGAFVNRIWGELMGHAFYEPVDDMGPLKDVAFAGVLTRLAAGFRATDYDIKGLLRVVMNSQTYQRQIRPGEAPPDAPHLAASPQPTQLRADALWQALVGTLGQLGQPPGAFVPPMAAMFGFRPGLEGQFKRLFDFDPSTRPDEVEGTIPQALMLMNNPVINQRIRAEGSNLLARTLSAYPRDDDALDNLYLRTFARRPTSTELAKCKKYINKVGKRAEAFEDILWALLNSTEFQTKR